MALIIPEIILLESYKKALSYIRNDYKNNLEDPTQSYLGLLLGNSSAIQRYNLLEQAKALFITTEDDPRNLDVNLFFNAKRASIPTIHITNPAESPIHDSLSIGEGIQDTLFDNDNKEYKKVFNRRFVSKYSIVITTDNTNEVILLYKVLQSITISMIEHLQLAGLENIKMSGGEINLKSDLIPINIFIKTIGLSFECDIPAIQLSVNEFGGNDFKPVITKIIAD